MAGLNPDTQEIIGKWLGEQGYTGLFNGECGCPIDDLFICGEIPMDCKAGYKIMCKPEDCRRDEDDGCQLECDGFKEGYFNWIISRTKEGR